MFSFRYVQEVQEVGLAGRERQRTCLPLCQILCIYCLIGPQNKPVRQIPASSFQLRKMRLRQCPVWTQMEGCNKLHPAPSVLPSLGADGGLSWSQSQSCQMIQYSHVRRMSLKQTYLPPRYPHEHSVLSTVLSIYQELVELDQNEFQI